jgi:hypothetical protein
MPALYPTSSVNLSFVSIVLSFRFNPFTVEIPFSTIPTETEAKPSKEISHVQSQSPIDRLVNLIWNHEGLSPGQTPFRYDPKRRRAEAQKGKHDDCIMAMSTLPLLSS